MTAQPYLGGELDLFAEAQRWKAMLRRRLSPWITGAVVEVGAGIGATTAMLCDPTRAEPWTCLEPDPELAAQVQARIDAGTLPARCSVHVGQLAGLPSETVAQTILYVDVLEHIADDRAELAEAAQRLAPGGHLVVAAPAHQVLFSPFDAQVGHFRRYDAAGLRAIAPPGLTERHLSYADSVGMLLSLANRALLRQSLPTRAQIRFWDDVIVPLSTLADPLTGYRLGKTVIAVWRR